MNGLSKILLALSIVNAVKCQENSETSAGSSKNQKVELFKIEGKITPPDFKPKDWHWRTRILVDGGRKYSSFLKGDNSFVIQGLPWGSYLIEILDPDYHYPPVRVDINSKGKIRARKVNNIQPSQVSQLAYPLRMKPLGRINYFEKREQWKLTDVFMNPMILMMVLPLLLITVLPKMMNDPETKREMEQMQQNMNVQNQVPDMSEYLANFLSGNTSSSSGEKKRKEKNETPQSSSNVTFFQKKNCLQYNIESRTVGDINRGSAEMRENFKQIL